MCHCGFRQTDSLKYIFLSSVLQKRVFVHFPWADLSDLKTTTAPRLPHKELNREKKRLVEKNKALVAKQAAGGETGGLVIHFTSFI